MSVEENKAIVARLVEELVNQGDMGVVDEIFSPEFVNHNRVLALRQTAKESSRVWR